MVTTFQALPSTAQNLLLVLVFFLVAWLVRRLSSRIARHMVQVGRWSRRPRADNPERRKTLQGVIAGLISVAALTIAVVASLALFVGIDRTVWMVGLFSAAFGLGAHRLVADVVSGMTLIFEDTFAVGEKVQLQDVEGVVEAVNIRSTAIRAPSGELYRVPNGEVRVVRNFSRGSFSAANVAVTVPAAELEQALAVLGPLGQEAVLRLPDLLEPWMVISETGVLTETTQLTLVAKARFGRAAELRPQLLAFVQEHLSEAGIHLGS
jgi:small conductance mechanosensitive channel